MKKLMYPCLSVVIATAFFSCEKDALIQEPAEQVKTEAPANPYRVSLKDALETADMFLTELDGTKTRSHRSPKSIEYYINRVHTRAGSDADTLLYIVNYDNNEGFAIVGADKRVKPIYAFSQNGNIDLSDTLENPGLAIYMENLRYTTANRLASYTSIRDSFPWPGFTEPTDPDLDDRTFRTIIDIPAQLFPNPANWAQTGHFNDACPWVTSGTPTKCPVGCVTLALSQVMSYYLWPQSLNNTPIDWDFFINTPIMIQPAFSAYLTEQYLVPNGLPQFLTNVGTTLNIKFSYPYTTGSYLNVINNIDKLGYTCDPKYKEIFTEFDIMDLNNGPVMAFGDISGLRPGHCWVIDGYYLYEEKWSAIANETHSNLYSFHHCVWGLGGHNNGWFDWDEGFGDTPADDPHLPDPDNDLPIISRGRYNNVYILSNFQPITK